MFAVPGWAVEAKSLITQQKLAQPHVPKDSEPGALSAQTSRKRKRQKDHARTKAPAITDENLADLWSKFIEGKRQGGSNRDVRSGKAERQKKKRRKTGESVEDQVLAEAGDNTAPAEAAHKKDEESKGDHPKPSHETHDFEAIAQPSDDKPTSENTTSPIQTSDIKLDKKARYEQRRIRALEKRSQNSVQQANGTLPPPRTTPPSNSLATTSHAKPAKPPSTKTHATHPGRPIIRPKASVIAALPPPESSPSTLTNALPPSPPSTKLTPLQISMRQKLISARFRHLNQTLYTTPSTQSSTLFTGSPSSYTSYHAGFRAQVAVWPQNPIDTFIADIKARSQVGSKGELLGSQKKRWREQRRGKISEPAKKSEENKEEGNSKVDALPRSNRRVCTIADLGCGDATLAASLAKLCKPFSLHIHSFDLAKGDGPNTHLITVADICGTVPLEDNSVDVAIFCLSLMGTNWVDSVQEAARIVRPGGEVWVAEIRSRFARQGEKRKGGIGQRRDEEPSADLDEEDGNDLKAGANETDVGPFADVFRKRGFVLQGEPDLRNKMFAKMRFLKTGHVGAASPGGVGVGAGVAGRAAGAGTGSDHARYGPKAKKKFLDLPASVLDQRDDNKVLKPCVYKTR